MLRATGLPPSSAGSAFAGRLAGNAIPLFDGSLCLRRPARRRPPRLSGTLGSFEYGPDVGSLLGAFVGATLHYQVLYSDAGGPCGSGIGASNSLRVAFRP